MPPTLISLSVTPGSRTHTSGADSLTGSSESLQPSATSDSTTIAASPRARPVARDRRAIDGGVKRAIA
jgi:hypothetical protein